MAMNLGELFVRVGADFSDLDRKFQAAQTSVARGAQDLENKFGKFEKTTSGLLVPTGALGTKLDEVGKASQKAGTNVHGMGTKMHGAGQQATGFFGALQDAHTQMNLMFGGMSMSAAFTAPFTLATKSAIDASVGFEQAFSGVRKTVDASEAEFADLENRFRGMAKTVPITAEEFARIGELAGQLGVRGVDNLTDFTDVVAKLGVSTDLATEEASMSLARFANIMQMPIKEVGKLGATIVHLGNNLATTESELTEFALRIAGAGKQVGLSEAEVLAFGAALSSVGINAEAGGTAISRVFAKIAMVTAQGGEDLEMFASVAGTSAEGFAKAFRDDAANATITFIEGLKRIQDSGGNVFGVLEKLELQDIRVRDALLRTAGAGDVLRRSLDLANTGWSEGIALNVEAEKKFATTGSKLQVLQNNLKELARRFGDTISEGLNPMISGLTKLVEGLQDISPGAQKAIMALGAILAVVGPLMIGLAGLGAAIAGIKVALPMLGMVFPGATGGAVLLAVALATLAGILGANAIKSQAASEQMTTLTKKYNAASDAMDKAVQTGGDWQTAADKQRQVIQEIGKKFPNLVTEWDKHGQAVAIDTEALKRNTKAAEENLLAKTEQAARKAKERIADIQDEIARLEKQRTVAGQQSEAIKARGFDPEQTLRDYDQMIALQRRKLTDAMTEFTDLRKAAFAPVAANDDFLTLDMQPAIRQVTETAQATEAAVQKTTDVLDVLQYKIQQVKNKWSLFNAAQGQATKGTEYAGAQQGYLRERLGSLQSALSEASSLYDASKAKTGEFSEETMKLGGFLNATKREIADTRMQMMEFSGPVAEAKDKLTAASAAVSEMNKWIVTLGTRLGEAKEKLEATNTSIKDLKDSSEDAKQGFADMLGVIADRIKDVKAEMDDLKDSTKTSQQAIADAFGVMTSRAGDLERQIDDARNAMKGLANVRLAGEGALDQELKDLERREALIKQAVNALRLGGVTEDDNRIKQLRSQLENIGLLKEGVQLKREIDFEPLREQLKRMVDDSKEMTFDEAKNAIQGYQKQIKDLGVQHNMVTQAMEAYRSTVMALVPSLSKQAMTLDQAIISILTHKASIEANNAKLSELNTKQTEMSDTYNDAIRSVKDLIPKIGNASLSFEEAETKMNAYKKTIEDNTTKLGDLYTAQTKQQGAVDFATGAIKLYNTELETLITKEKDAASAVDAFRSALATAAAVLAGIRAPAFPGGGSNSGGSSPKPLLMAEGGLTKRPVFMGEAGPEVFAPLADLWSRMEAMSRNVAMTVAGRMSGFAAGVSDFLGYRGAGMSMDGRAAMAAGGNMTFNVNIGGRELHDLIIEAIHEGERRGRIKPGTTIF